MMSKIRKQLKSTGFKVVLWIIGFSIVGASSLILFFKNIISRKPTVDIAYVDNLVISRSEFVRTLQGFERFFKMVPQLFPNLKKEDLVNFVLENILFVNKVFQSKAESAGIKVGESYICNKLKDKDFMLLNFSDVFQPEVYKDSRLDKNLLLKNLKNQNISLEQFESLIKEKLETSLFQELVSDSIYFPNYLLIQKYIQDYSKKKFNILTVKLDSYLKNVELKKLEENEIQDFFNKNLDNYRVPEKRSIDLWTFDPESYNISVTEDEIKQYKNNENKDDKNLQDLRPEIEKNIRLDKFKKEFNLDAKRIIFESNNSLFDKFVKDKNGLKSSLENISADSNNDLLTKKVFSLSKVSDKSFYQNQNKGYIINLNSITESYIPELKDVKNKVIKDIYNKKAKEALELDLDNFIKSKENLETIEKNVKGSKLEKTDWIEINKINKLYNNIPNNIFKNLFELNQKIKYIDNNGYLIELSEVQDFDQKDFEEKKDQIKHKFFKEQGQAIENDLRSSWRREAKILLNNDLFSNK